MPEPQGELTALLAHGKNWELLPEVPGAAEPSFDTRLTAEAAGILYTAEDGPHFDRLILSTGHTKGDDYPSEAQAMLDVLRERFDESEIPSEVIIMEDRSLDTASNLRRVNEICRQHNIGSIALLTVGYHMPRTKRLAHRLLNVPISSTHKSNVVVRMDRNESGFFYIRSVMREVRAREGVRKIGPIIRLLSSLVLEGGAYILAPFDRDGDGVSSGITSILRHKKK